ncbi:DAK2 domain fusion protein YloV [Kitasatospora sp. MAA4]|uniref:DAK2 domain-containing protein n=1 Tax=Kitasatospora sp. MAA4 TaxID=3035093 RepID=UPI0024748F5D|nr:DAK2 domain-containing protein [Kitasatospora sp. MAA4]MDH6137022.1 DAK2 domain fusion protein YloV [Kitasatospora sp. MAA4]
MQDTLDALAVRTWCRLALSALGQAREEIDALNVYPVPDGDTGTNLYLTAESATAAVEECFDATGEPGLDIAVRAMAKGALIGARGNSGVILAQLLRGTAEVLAQRGGGPQALSAALRRGCEAAYQAVAEPVEGTLLTVAACAADSAERAEQAGGGLAEIAGAAHQEARQALLRTPSQLDVLARAGVVDAGGRGLVAVLGALADAVTGQQPMGPVALGEDLGTVAAAGCEGHLRPPGPGHPAFEVIYLLDAPDAALPALRERLAGLGDSLVVGGGDGLWNVHVHVDDAGAAVEAGVEAGRPYRIRITHFAEAAARAGTGGEAGPAARAVLSVVTGEGLAELCLQAGAAVLRADPDAPPSSAELAQAVRGCAAGEVIVLLNDAELRATAGAAADQLREEGVRVAVLPTRSPVQGLAALAVHEAGRRFDEDVVAMTSAAGATRYAELAVAEGESWTMAGVCQAGDVLGLIDGDVAVIGQGIAATGAELLSRMLAAGGELVTLVLGEGVPPGLADQLVAHARRQRPEVDTVVFDGGQQSAPLLIGVE